MSDELNPCPFCGSAVEYSKTILSGEHTIGCPNDSCGFVSYWYVVCSKDQVLAAWNSRIENQSVAPCIGEEWPDQGGVYAGIVRGQDGQPDYHLIVGPEFDDPEFNNEIGWGDAIEWAVNLAELTDFFDYSLPNLRECRFLFCNAKDQFKFEHWSSEQHAEWSTYAWLQDFRSGNQYQHHKATPCHARAVRRIPILSSTSVERKD